MKQNRSKPKSHRSMYIGSAVVLLVVLLAFGAYELWHKPTVNTSIAGQDTAATSKNAAPAVYPTTPKPNPDPNVPGGPTASETTQAGYPEKPSGSFVSDYSATTTQSLESTCNSTTGATCVVSFTNGSTTKSLPSETTTSSPKEAQVAMATWDWQPADIGLTVGSWTVTATASLNGHDASTISSTKLVVTQ